MVPKKTQRTPLPMDGSTGTKTKRSDTMNHGMPLNSAFTAHLIAAEERHQIMLRASQQRRLLKESERAFGKVRASRPSRIRRGFGSLLTRAAERDRVFRKLIEVVGKYSDADLARPATEFGLDEPGKTLLAVLIEYHGDHFEEHRGYIERIIA
jgi:hypothetical protein